MSRKKRIIVWETLSTVSGGQKMTLMIMDLLSDEYDFCCLIPEKGMLSDELEKRGIKYVLMGNQSMPTGIKGKRVIFQYGWMSLKNIIKSLKVIRKYQPDFLYAPGPAALPWSAVCGTLTRRPVVWHLHHIFLDKTTKKLLNVCGSWKSVKSIISVSNCVGSQITNEKGKGKIKVIYNPIDVDKYSNGNPDNVIREIESSLNRRVDREKTVLLTHIGAITKNKCQDFFLQVVNEYKKLNNDVIGLVIGDAITESDKVFKNQLITYINANNLQSNIFMPGFRKDIPNILAASSCVIVPSSEGLPLAALEAMSAKVPVVSIDSNGAFELLEAAQCGAFYPTGGTAEMAVAAIKNALQEQSDNGLQRGFNFCKGLSKETYLSRLHMVFKTKK